MTMTSQSSEHVDRIHDVLTGDQIETYLRQGVLVVPDILSHEEVQLALRGMKSSLEHRGVLHLDALVTGDANHVTDNDVTDNDDTAVLNSARAFRQLSSTNGSGGVLDIFWDDWKLRLVAHNERLWNATRQLWRAVYDSPDDVQDTNDWRWHPYHQQEEEEETERIDFSKGYCYVDRVGYRLPTPVSEAWGDRLYQDENASDAGNDADGNSSNSSKKKTKLRSVQRSLTPHLDCCPDNMWGEISTAAHANSDSSSSPSHESTKPQKWRPVQCFVALTDTLHPNEGGFECVPGFHREFHEWSRIRSEAVSTPSSSLCVGEYTHIRPKEDCDVMRRIQHLPVTAGSAVFWDVRIPHANSYRNSTRTARQVVYCSFLPDIELNRRYIQHQLSAYRNNQPIRDQWNHIPSGGDEEKAGDCDETRHDTMTTTKHDNFTELGQKLMGIRPW